MCLQFTPPDWKKYTKSGERLHEKIRDAKEGMEKDMLRQEIDRLDEERKAAELVFYRLMFWVAYPVGLGAFIIGTFFWVQAIGAGLMFGASIFSDDRMLHVLGSHQGGSGFGSEFCRDRVDHRPRGGDMACTVNLPCSHPSA